MIPADVYGEIARVTRREDLPAFSRVSKTLQRVSVRPRCDLPITIREFEEYYQEMTPWNFGIFYPEKTNSYASFTYTQLLAPKNIREGRNTGWYFPIYIDLGLEPTDEADTFEYKYHNEEGWDEYDFNAMRDYDQIIDYINALPSRSKADLQFDLYSQYHIYKRRSICQTLRDYGHEETLKNFDRMVTSYETEVRELKRKAEQNKVVDIWPELIPASILHLYLYQQCRCLNVIPTPTAITIDDYVLLTDLDIWKRPGFHEDARESIEELKTTNRLMVKEIDLVVPKIREAIMKLS